MFLSKSGVKDQEKQVVMLLDALRTSPPISWHLQLASLQSEETRKQKDERMHWYMKPSQWTSSLLPYWLSPQNTKGGKTLQAWISQKKLSSLVFVSGSVLFAPRAELSIGLCYRGNVLLVSFRVSFAFFYLLSSLIHHANDVHLGFMDRAWLGKAWGSNFGRSNSKPGDSDSNTAPFHVKFSTLMQTQYESLYAGLCFNR